MRIFRLFPAVIFLALSLADAPSAPAVEAAASTQAPQTRLPQAGPLKPGRTAGVQKAQQQRAGLALIGAGAIVAVVVVAAGSSGGGSGPSAQNNNFAPTTTSP
jgi:hypothetical protein